MIRPDAASWADRCRRERAPRPGRRAVVAALLGVACARATTPVPPAGGPVEPRPVAPSSSRGGAAEGAAIGAAGAGGAAPSAAAPASGSAPAPLSASAPLLELAVPGHGPAVVSLPIGATTPRPLLVATHGNFDRPDSTCAVWREIVADEAFVLCPRGVARGDSPSPREPYFHYLTNRHLEREIEAGLSALDAAFSGYLAAPPYVYAGFSQGAIMGVELLARRPEWFDRAVLIEGGFDRWSRGSIAAYAAAGGRRVLFACGQWACDHAARSLEPWFAVAGVGHRVVFAPGLGHTYGGELSDRILAEWGWLVGDDPRWTTGLTGAADEVTAPGERSAPPGGFRSLGSGAM